MLNAVRDKIGHVSLGTRAERYGLRARPKPYYLAIERGLYLGYKKPLSGAGKWIIRHCLGGPGYTVRTLASADDFSDANGTTILNFEQAQERVRLSSKCSTPALVHDPKSLTIAKVVTYYLEFLERSHKSARDARYRANAFILPKLGSLDVGMLSASALRTWLMELALAPARPRSRANQTQRPAVNEETQRRRRATANRTLAVLKAALNCALREGRIKSTPIWRGVEPFQNVERAAHYLTLEQVTRLVNSCEGDLENLVKATLYTGARLSELIQLTVEDFNVDFGTISIRQGRKPRHILLTGLGLAFFSEICANRCGTDLLFKKKSKKWYKSRKGSELAAACLRARIDPPITFAALRHTYASLSTRAGLPLELIATNLGHADLRMVRVRQM